jgi:hypothetical protein
MTTAKQTAFPPQGHSGTATEQSSAGALIPVQRIEALMAMGRAFPLVVTALSLGLLVSIGLSCCLVYRDTQRVPTFFATDYAGRVIEIKPLSEPSMTREQVAQYVVNALSESMSMDYINFSDTQDRASRYFTQDAFNALVKNFTDQGHYDLLKKRKAVARAVATGAPRVVAEGQTNASSPYSWVIQVPIAWTFSSQQRASTVNYVVQAVVTRQSTVERANGIAISAITVSSGKVEL